ncbi:MAG TPA: TetR/AcrR family transcriptional regulator [Solirubrobacteraceae bacterium]
MSRHRAPTPAEGPRAAPARGSHREALLDAAKRLLRDKGYARTTARDLVAESGTNLASIGYHFGSKEALLNEALGQAFAEWTERLDAIAMAEAGAKPLERLVAGWRAMFADLEGARPIFVAFLEALAQAERSDDLRAQLAAQYEETRRQLAETVAGLIGGDAAAGSDADVVASFLIAVCDGVLIQSFLVPGRLPAGDDFFAALTRALASALPQ